MFEEEHAGKVVAESEEFTNLPKHRSEPIKESTNGINDGLIHEVRKSVVFELCPAFRPKTNNETYDDTNDKRDDADGLQHFPAVLNEHKWNEPQQLDPTPYSQEADQLCEEVCDWD